MKKTFKILTAAALAITASFTTAAMAADNISILIDGVILSARDANGNRVYPIERGGTTYLPVRAIGTAFGRSVDWDGNTRTVYIGGGNRATVSPSDEIQIYIDGNKIDPRDANGASVPPFIEDGTTYMPVRAIAQAFGKSVSWNGEDQQVVLVSPGYEYPWAKAQGDDKFTLIFTGGWDKVHPAHKEWLEYQFKHVFPKLMARWGTTGREAKTVAVKLSDNLTKASRIAETLGPQISVSPTWVIDKTPSDYQYFSHELVHVVQNSPNFKSHWWKENMAEYGCFRYFHSVIDGEEIVYDKNDPEVRDWNWEPYGKCEWFFAYMDSKYPTRKTANGIEPGLIDSINLGIKNGVITDDGIKDLDGNLIHDNDAFNAVVKSVTGFDNIELLRQQYVRDLDSGAWSFNGFDGYEDNFLTDGVDADVTVVNAYSGDSLPLEPGDYQNSLFEDFDMSNELAVQYMGERTVSAYKLVDGDTESPSLWNENSSLEMDLGAKKTFSSYALINGDTNDVDDSWRGMAVREWKLYVSDDGQNWTEADHRTDVIRGASTYDIGNTSARYVKLEVLKTEQETAALYELMLIK